ncbi:MAG: adenylate/guanylate cyclase domain-containing protein [Chloroflexota bacterium]
MTQVTTPHGHETQWSSECVICATALDGLVSVPFRLMGVSRSARNPNLCNRCNTHAEEGRVVEITVLFADLSSFTELTHDLGPERTHEVVDAFLQMATYSLVRHDAFIDKYVGDAVMAFFNVPIRREDHSARAVAAAQDLLAGVPALNERFGLNLNAVVSIASGFARVGTLGSTDGKDYTAIGDVVNLASRLEGVAARGEIVVDDAVYQAVRDDVPGVVAESVTLKGFKEPVNAYRIGATPGSRPIGSRLAAGPMDEGRQRLTRIGALIFGMLGAPCAVGTLIGPMAIVLGLGVFFGTVVSSFIDFLDIAIIRIPALILGTIGASANLYTVWHASQIRKAAQAQGQLYLTTTYERRQTRFVVGLAILTLLFVSFELYAHTNIMGRSWP